MFLDKNVGKGMFFQRTNSLSCWKKLFTLTLPTIVRFSQTKLIKPVSGTVAWIVRTVDLKFDATDPSVFFQHNQGRQKY